MRESSALSCSRVTPQKLFTECYRSVTSRFACIYILIWNSLSVSILNCKSSHCFTFRLCFCVRVCIGLKFDKFHSVCEDTNSRTVVLCSLCLYLSLGRCLRWLCSLRITRLHGAVTRTVSDSRFFSRLNGAATTASDREAEIHHSKSAQHLHKKDDVRLLMQSYPVSFAKKRKRRKPDAVRISQFLVVQRP